MTWLPEDAISKNTAQNYAKYYRAGKKAADTARGRKEDLDNIFEGAIDQLEKDPTIHCSMPEIRKSVIILNIINLKISKNCRLEKQ